MTDRRLVRHGDAVAAPALSGRMGTFDLVASSGTRRARQTAEILGAAAGYPADRIVDTEAPGPNAPVESFLGFLAASGAVCRIRLQDLRRDCGELILFF